MNGSLYLIVDLCALAIPFAFSRHPKIRFIDEWSRFWPACLVTMAFFIAWDVFFTAKGIWGFNEAHLVGLSLFGLPLEEWMFFVAIPYSCVFTYFVIRSNRKAVFSSKAKTIVLAFAGLSLGLCLYNLSHWYTASATGLCGILCLVLLRKNPVWLADFLLAFGVLLLPFVLTNGILTGVEFWQSAPIHMSPETITNHIVWYANEHNLGIRFFTIPVEDFFYAFLLIGMNVFLFERWSSKKASKERAK